ncbi:MAG: hypothetical protein WAN42_09010, partial [Pseudolabrys sp.]
QNSFSSETLVFLPLMKIERLKTAVLIANFRSDPFVAPGVLLQTGVLSALRCVKKYSKSMAA